MTSKKGDYRRQIGTHRKYRKEHAQQRNEYSRQWRLKHPRYTKTEKYRQDQKEYRQQHAEKNKQYFIEWRKKHPEYEERRKQWRHEHFEQVKSWSHKESEEAKKQRLLNQAKWREENAERVKLYTYIHDHEEDYPLAQVCELCPENDTRKATHRHHPDYEFPEIYVSCCDRCHQWAHKIPVFYPIVRHVSSLVSCSNPHS